MDQTWKEREDKVLFFLNTHFNIFVSVTSIVVNKNLNQLTNHDRYYVYLVQKKRDFKTVLWILLKGLKNILIPPIWNFLSIIWYSRLYRVKYLKSTIGTKQIRLSMEPKRMNCLIYYIFGGLGSISNNKSVIIYNIQ